MKRTILVVVLLIGAVSGFGFGFRSWHFRAHHHHRDLERHVAEVCVEAAERVYGDKSRGPSPGKPGP